VLGAWDESVGPRKRVGQFKWILESLWWFQSFARLRLLKENPCQQVREILVLERRTAHYWLMVGPSGSSALEENVRNLRMFRMECVQHTQVLLSH